MTVSSYTLYLFKQLQHLASCSDVLRVSSPQWRGLRDKHKNVCVGAYAVLGMNDELGSMNAKQK